MFFQLLHYLRGSKLSRYLRTTKEGTSWAFISGASDGIGAAFAGELAMHGFNLVLHGRNPTKLEAVRDSIASRYPKCQIRLVYADAARFTTSDIATITKTVADIPLTVLINNVGGAQPLKANFQTLAAHSVEEIDDMINLNVRFGVHLTHALLPKLTSNTPALIMNIGSQAQAGMPYMSVYSGTKGFVRAFSKSLEVEFRSEGKDVEVMEIVVGSVASNQNQTDPTFFVPSSQVMAKSALARVGCGEAHSAAYIGHLLQFIGAGLTPQSLLDSMTVKFLKPLAGKAERKW